MALETATYLDDLVATNPTSTDPKSQGDDHIRLLKAVLLATFPNLGAAVTASPTELNYSVGVTSALQTQLNLLAGQVATGGTVPLWVSGTTYALGESVVSPSSLLTYRRKVAGAGTTDPVSDSTNWQLASNGILISARTSNTILGLGDYSTLVDITSGTFSQTFTAASSLGNGWFCYLRNSGTGSITLEPDGSELIDGLTNYVMYPGECRILMCTGTAFKTIVVNPFYFRVTATGPFIVPPGYNYFLLDVIGASGGSASGRRGAAGSVRNGGSGSGGGARNIRPVYGLTPGTTITCTIGAGGTAGAAVTVNDTDGNDGGVGGTSSFGSYVLAYGGGPGQKGTAAAAAGASGGSIGTAGAAGTTSESAAIGGSVNTFQNSVGGIGAGSTSGATANPAGCSEYGGGAGRAADGSGGDGLAGGSSIYGGPGGGPGGGITSGNIIKKGGAGGACGSYVAGGGGAGGQTDGAAGTAGTDSLDQCGSAGGGGAASATGPGGQGGLGGIPGGAPGGGAASLNGQASGAGRVGSRGEIRISGGM